MSTAPLHRLALVSATFLAILTLIAIFAELLVSEAPIVLYRDGKLHVLPELTAPIAASERLDQLSERDLALWPLVKAAPAASAKPASAAQVFAETVRGTRRLVVVTLSVLLLAAAIGSALGMLASVGPTIADAALARAMELGGAFPSIILLALFLRLQGGTGVFSFILIVAALRSLEVARVLRGELNKLQKTNYVRAARALGLHQRDILTRHILPHAIGPALVSLSFTAALVVGLETALWFLGLTPTPTMPSWGRMLAQPNGGRAVAAVGIVLTTGALYTLSEWIFAYFRGMRACDARQSE